jgi:hypothetical protein
MCTLVGHEHAAAVLLLPTAVMMMGGMMSVAATISKQASRGFHGPGLQGSHAGPAG